MSFDKLVSTYSNRNLSADLKPELVIHFRYRWTSSRPLAYKGIVSEPLYYVDENGNVLDDLTDNKPSFFREYNWKLKNIYDKFFTDRARMIAEERQKASVDFFESMFREVYSTHKAGMHLLERALEGGKQDSLDHL